MAFPCLTVCLDEGRAAPARLRVALALAAQQRAHLHGLHLSYMPSPALAACDGAAAIYGALERDLASRQAAAREAFLAAAAAAGVSASFVAASSLDLDAATAHARASDLVLAGQPDPEDSAAYVGAGYPARLVLELGRPVLFLPREPAPAAAFRHVAVAWNGSREASRALFDALPLLRRAERVTLLSAGREHGVAPGQVPAPDARAVLERHGIRAGLRVNAAAADAGQWLLQQAGDPDDPADLLVAGAYGHSRFAEMVLGGATRTLLEGMTLPVLLSH